MLSVVCVPVAFVTDYDKKYNDIEEELKAFRDERNEKYEALQGEESITTRINDP